MGEAVGWRLTDALKGVPTRQLQLVSHKDEDARNELFRRQLNWKCWQLLRRYWLKKEDEKFGGLHGGSGTAAASNA